MKNIYYNIFSLLFIAILGFGVASCDNDDDVKNSGEVVLLSFGPSGVEHGDEIGFFGENLNKVESIQLGEATIQQAEFIEQTTDMIKLIVPITATKSKAILKTSNGDVESKTEIGYTVPITITSFMPESIRAGENLTITGEFLNWVREIYFYNDVLVTDFESQTLTELVVKVPLEAQTGFLVLTDGEVINDPFIVQTEEELVVALPEVTSMAPVPLQHTDELTISGNDLDLVKEIIFPGDLTVVDFTSQSETEIKVPVPAASLNGPLTLVTYSAIDIVTTQEIIIVLPVATSFNPNPIDPLAVLTIAGTNLDLVKEVIFTGDKSVLMADFNSHSATQIKLVAPEGILKGPLTLVTVHDFNVLTDIKLEISGDLPPLDPLGLACFDDNYQNGYGDWGYGGPTTVVGTIVRDGDNAIMKTFDGSWDAVRFGQDAPGQSTAGYSKLVFSVFGGPGTNGQVANVIVNDNWGASTITIVEGEWTEYTYDLSSIGSPDNLAGTGLQAHGWSGTIYVDHVGLR